ncbi:MAG: amidohydrolase family protein [Candidatus Omnitrophica bacterium]|nr:amidohydrolase family protein [Candidatus Omnitrophota bacterium]
MNKYWNEFLKKGKIKNLPVIDIHCHMGFFYGSHMPYTEPEKMAERMEISGVKLCVFAHHYSLFDPEIGNKIVIEVVRRFPDKFKGYFSINPNYNLKDNIENFEKYNDVFVGFKLLPDYHKVPLSDRRYKNIFDFADEKGIIILSHTWGGSIYNGPIEVEKILKKYKKIKLILGHSLHSAWDKTIEIIKNYENAYLELCAVMDERGVLEKIVSEIGSDKILFGTDFPWFNHHYYIGSLFGAGLSENEIRKILYLNSFKLLFPTGKGK